MSASDDRLASGSMAAFNLPARAAGRPWIAGSAAAAWLAPALLTAFWPDKQGSDWAYTRDLAAAFGALAATLAFATFASIRSVPAAAGARPCTLALALALFLRAWEAATAKLGLLPLPFFPPPQALLEVMIEDWARLCEGVLASL